MNISDFSAWLDGLLEPHAFKDYCVDGLCVEASDKVTRIVTGVSFRDRLIDAAIENKADCIIVHHPNGFWQGENRVLVGKFGERMRRLMQNGISLYGYHLPLDGHPEVGNNVLIAKAFGLKNLEGFIREGERTVGYVGEFEEPVSREGFVELACGVLSAVGEAKSLGCDTFVTGEIKENVPIAVEELGFNLLACGHHRTEIFGVRALARKIEAELGIPASFVDIDNPV